MYVYINDTLISKRLEGMSNVTTKAKLFENHGLATLFQDTVGDWIINFGLKYNYAN